MQSEDDSMPLSARLLAWAPLLIVAMLVWAMEVYFPDGRYRSDGGLPYPVDLLRWLAFSGNAILLSWTMVCWWYALRRSPLSPIPGEGGLMPGLVAVGLHTFWLLFFDENRDGSDLAPLIVILAGPTLLLAYWLLGWGLARVERSWVVILLAAGLALLTSLCQLGWGSLDTMGDTRLFTLSSVVLGAAAAIRLTIWWVTDEGFSEARHA